MWTNYFYKVQLAFISQNQSVLFSIIWSESVVSNQIVFQAAALVVHTQPLGSETEVWHVCALFIPPGPGLAKQLSESGKQPDWKL